MLKHEFVVNETREKYVGGLGNCPVSALARVKEEFNKIHSTSGHLSTPVSISRDGATHATDMAILTSAGATTSMHMITLSTTNCYFCLYTTTHYYMYRWHC